MRTQRTRGLRRLGVAVGLVAGAIGLAAMPAFALSAQTSGTLKVVKGGYRAVGTDTAEGFAKPLAGATLEYATSSGFGSPTSFAPTDALGIATASVPTGAYFAREKTPPAGWSNIATLDWGGSTGKAYQSTSTTVTSGNTSIAQAASDSQPFINEFVNPKIQATCRTGLNVLMVLDTSRSTKGYGQDYNAAAKAFINQLSGTTTTLKINSFATTSTANAATYDLSSAGGQTSAKTFVDGVVNAGSGSGSTNWDAAMQDASKAKVDVVVFITDGNPTIHVGGSGSLADLTYGIASANLAKNPDMSASANGDEQAVLAVGVGAGIALNNLQAISGPTAGKDYAVASNPADLAALLKELATTICPADLGITKTVTNEPISPGGTINYDITVKNGGAVTVPFASIKVEDPTATTLTPPAAAPLAPGASLVWKATKTVAKDEKLCNTKVANTATVALVDLPGYTEPDTSNNTSTVTTTLSCPLDVSIVKTATSASVAPGGAATYDVTVKNTGAWTVPFASINIADPNAALTPPADTSGLAAGASRTWTAIQKVSSDATCGGLASNTATVSLDGQTIAVANVTDPHTSTATTPVVCPVSFTIKKTGDTTVLADGTIKYTIDVTNTGNFPVPFNSINVTDPGATLVPPDDTADLAKGDTRTWTATRTAPNGAKDCGTTVTNTATVGLTDTKGYVNPGGDTSSSFDTLVNCPVSFGIKKTGDLTVLADGIVNYNIDVTNTGKYPVPFGSIAVTDPGAVVIAPGTTTALAANETRTWTATRKAPGAADDCGTLFTNTASVGLDDTKGYINPGGDQSSFFKTLVNCPISFSITKDGDPTVLPGGTIKYTIVVGNPGTFPIPFSAINVTDPNAQNLTGPVDPPDFLLPGENLTWTAEHPVELTEKLCNTSVMNTALVSLGDVKGYVNPDGTQKSDFTTDVVCPLQVGITKTATNGPVAPGGSATYDVTVKNTGAWTVPFDAISVKDPGAVLTDPTNTDPLAAGESRVWTATKDVPSDTPCDIGTVSNTASVSLVEAQVPTALKAEIAVDPNHTSTATTDVVCPVDVTAVKSTTSTTVVPGGTVPYTITVTNPSGFAVPFSAISVTDTGATITPPADTTDLAPGASRIWTATKVAADGTAACATTVSNTAQVALVNLPSGYSAITPGGSSASATGVTIGGGICNPVVVPAATPDAPIAIAARPQLTVRKSGPAVARKGSGVTYRIKVTNSGPLTATNVVITDTPPSTMLIGGTPTGATRSGRTLSWAIGDLAAGTSRTVTVTLGMRLTASGTPCNIASATAENADSARGKACTRIQAVRDPRVTG